MSAGLFEYFQNRRAETNSSIGYVAQLVSHACRSSDVAIAVLLYSVRPSVSRLNHGQRAEPKVHRTNTLVVLQPHDVDAVDDCPRIS